MKAKIFECASGSRVEAYLHSEGIGLRVSGVNLPPSGAHVTMKTDEARRFREFIDELLDDRFERYGDERSNGRAA